jgi:Rho GDP-dissociation inhibitor
VILLSLGLEVEGRPDIVIDLTQKGALDTLIKKPFTIKEGATFRMKARFRVQHEILSGMKYVQVVSRMGAKTKMQEMIVCFSYCTTYPYHDFYCSEAVYVLTCFYRAPTRPTPPTSLSTRRSVRFHHSPLYFPHPPREESNLTPSKVESETAPSGMLFRGHYEAVSVFTDDDKNEYLKFKWAFDIKKDW